MPCLRPGLHSRTHRAWAKVLSLLQQGRGRLQSLPAGKPRRREGGTGGLETDSSPRKPVPALSGWGRGDSAHQRRVPCAHEARTPPAPWAPGGRVSARRPQPTPLAACRVATPRRLRCRRGRATERVCGERGSRSHGDGRRGFRGEGCRWPCRRTPGPCPARPDTLRESKHVQDSCSWTGMLCGSAPRPRTSPNSWLHGAFRGQPCSLCSDTGYRSLPCRSEGSPLPEAPADCPSSAPRQPGWLSVRSGFPGCMAGSAHPSICTLSRRLCVPVPKAALRNHTQSHCPPLPHAHPTQAGHVAHGAAQASDTRIRPGSGRNRSQGATPTKRRTRWARMRRAWAPPPVCPRGEDDSHRDEGTRDRSSEAASRPGPGAGKVSSPKSFHHENMKTFRRWNVSFNERKAT